VSLGVETGIQLILLQFSPFYSRPFLLLSIALFLSLSVDGMRDVKKGITLSSKDQRFVDVTDVLDDHIKRF